jgi:hypothetical protein
MFADAVGGVELAAELGDMLAVHDLDDVILDSLDPLAHRELDPLPLFNLEVMSFLLRLFAGEMLIHFEYGKCAHGGHSRQSSAFFKCALSDNSRSSWLA